MVGAEDVQFSSVQSLSRVRLFVTPWTAAYQAFLSFTISRSLLKLMSVESVIPSNHLILCHSLLQGIFPTQGSNPELPHCRKILRWLNGITDSTDMSLSKFWEKVKYREPSCAAVHGVAKS